MTGGFSLSKDFSFIFWSECTKGIDLGNESSSLTGSTGATGELGTYFSNGETGTYFSNGATGTYDSTDSTGTGYDSTGTTGTGYDFEVNFLDFFSFNESQIPIKNI